MKAHRGGMTFISTLFVRLGFWRQKILAHRIFHALSWTMIAHLVQQVIRLASNLILARLLAPEMFGIMAAILAVQMILANLSDIGLRLSIIQSARGDDPEFLNTVWSMQILRGLAIWLITLIVALLLSLAAQFGWLPANSTWAAPEMAAALALTGFSAVIDGTFSTKIITAQRNLNFKRLVAIDLIAQIVSIAVMLGLVVVSRSIWPLVIGGLAHAAMKSVLSHFWLEGSLNRLSWNRQDAAEISGFGIWILISSTATVISNNIDRLLFGALFPAATLGLYSIALALATMVETLGGKIFGEVLMPTLSEAARVGKSEFRKKLYMMRLPLDAMFLLGSGALFAFAPSVIHLLYDHRYQDAGYILQVLSVSLVFTRYGSANVAYLALGKPELHACVMFVKLAAALLFILLGHHLFGFQGALWGVAIHGLVPLPFIFYFNWRNDILLWRLELMVLPAWPIGFAIGSMMARLI